MANLSLACFLLCFLGSATGRGEKYVRVHVPAYVQQYRPVTLACQYRLSAGTKLYTLKWYRDEQEIFVHEPGAQLVQRNFPESMVQVDIDKSNATHIHFNSVSNIHTGSYTCEVSGEGPIFDTMQANGTMHVIVPPPNGIEIEMAGLAAASGGGGGGGGGGGDAGGNQIGGGEQVGGSGANSSATATATVTASVSRLRYRIGDRVVANCTCRHTSPAAQLTWYINGEAASLTHLHYYTPEVDPVAASVVSVTVGLHFHVHQRHFRSSSSSAAAEAGTAAGTAAAGTYGEHIVLKCVGALPGGKQPEYLYIGQVTLLAHQQPAVSRVVSKSRAASVDGGHCCSLCCQLANWLLLAISVYLAL